MENKRMNAFGRNEEDTSLLNIASVIAAGGNTSDYEKLQELIKTCDAANVSVACFEDRVDVGKISIYFDPIPVCMREVIPVLAHQEDVDSVIEILLGDEGLLLLVEGNDSQVCSNLLKKYEHLAQYLEFRNGTYCSCKPESSSDFFLLPVSMLDECAEFFT